MAETVFVVRDDYDQTTVCVVRAESNEQAVETANRNFAEVRCGDFYALAAELLDGRLVVVPEAK